MKLPKRSEATFSIGSAAGPEYQFGIQVYGANRAGWCVASLRVYGRQLDSGVRQLPKGEWLTLLHLIERCGFWSLPEDGSHLTDPDVSVDDGEWLTVEGWDTTRYHRVHRYVWWEPGLNGVLAFGQRVSGFFVRHPTSGSWVLHAVVPKPVLPPQVSDASHDQRGTSLGEGGASHE